MVFGLLVVGEVFWLATGVVFGLVAGTVFGLAVLGSMLSRFLNWLTDGTVGAVFGLVVLGSTLSSFFNWFADITIGVVFGFGAGLLEAVFADAALALLLPLLFELEALPRDFLFILGFGILDGIVSGVGA